MKVLLVNPSYNFPVAYEMYPSGALLLLGTLSRHCGHDVRLIHMVTDGKNTNDVVRTVREWRPDIVGITVSTFQAKAVKALTRRIKRDAGSFIVIGGVHPSSIGQDAAQTYFPHVDSIICGEGERAFLALLGEGRTDGLRNLNYLTPPDLTLVDISRFTGAHPVGGAPAMFLMASRGCPSNCTFCNKSIFGNRVRYRDPENVIRELKYLDNYGIREVFIQDDTFNLNRAWYEEILGGIITEKLNTRMRFRAPFRADEKLVDKNILELAKRAGFWLVFYGVESGNQGMLDRMHKKLTLEEIERAVRLTKEAGIKAETSFIVGLPGETQQSLDDTLSFYQRLRPFWSGCGTAIPFPSTALYAEVQSQLTIPFENYEPGLTYFRTEHLNKQQITMACGRLNRAMMLGKMKSLTKHPNMLLRTARTAIAMRILAK